MHLPVEAHVRLPLHGDRRAVLHPRFREPRPALRLELAQQRLDAREVRVREPHRPRAGRLVGDRRHQEPERRGRARGGRDHHLAHPEFAGDTRGMERARAAHRHHRVAARVAALLHDVHAGRPGHVLAHQVVDAPRRFRDGKPQGRGEPRHRGLGGGGVEGHPAAQEIARVQVAEEQVRVRHRRMAAAQPVAGGTGLGARALRPDLEQSELVDPRDRASARADLHHVDHRRVHREAASLLETGGPSPPRASARRPARRPG